MYLVKTPSLFRFIYPSLVWKMPRNEKTIYLTFDDGPIPDVTDFVLKTLDDFKIKATFFCIGDNILKHPRIYQALKDANHAIGNHTFNHLRGWDTPTDVYTENFKKCQELTATHLFRPPYGRIKFAQIKAIKKAMGSDLKIIMWDILTGDYDSATSPEDCLENSIKHTRNGSIVVFHDSLKAKKNMQYALPKYIEYFKDKGYSFATL